MHTVSDDTLSGSFIANGATNGAANTNANKNNLSSVYNSNNNFNVAMSADTATTTISTLRAYNTTTYTNKRPPPVVPLSSPSISYHPHRTMLFSSHENKVAFSNTDVHTKEFRWWKQLLAGGMFLCCCLV